MTNSSLMSAEMADRLTAARAACKAAWEANRDAHAAWLAGIAAAEGHLAELLRELAVSALTNNAPHELYEALFDGHWLHHRDAERARERADEAERRAA
jgi:hypothetical protein